MAKGEVVVTAEQYKKKKKFEKIVIIVLLVLLLLLAISYFVLNIIYNEGSFTISMDKNTYLRSNLVMYESLNNRSNVRRLSTAEMPFMDNISIKWLPDNIQNEADGAHNGKNYIDVSDISVFNVSREGFGGTPAPVVSRMDNIGGYFWTRDHAHGHIYVTVRLRHIQKGEKCSY